MLTKNSFLEEINKQYVLTARAKGLDERRVLYGHVFRNAMLIVIAGFPAAFIGMLFTGALLIEVIFSLDGSACWASRRRSTATTRSCSARSMSSPCSAWSWGSSATSSTPWSIRASTSRRAR